VDLSAWSSLTDEDIINLAKITKSDSIVEVDVSNIPHVITPSCSASLVKICPQMRFLSAIDTPSLPYEELQAACAESKLYRIWHTSNLRAPRASNRRVLAPEIEAMSSTAVGLRRARDTVIQVFHHNSFPRANRTGGEGYSETCDPSGLPWRQGAEELVQNPSELCRRGIYLLMTFAGGRASSRVVLAANAV